MQKFYQRDIVKTKVKMSNGEELTHPCLIISCEAANSHELERCYIGVMITHAGRKDRFCKEITKEMVETHWTNEWSQIRLHIIIRFRESDISRDVSHYVGRMKLIHFKSVLDDIHSYVLHADK